MKSIYTKLFLIVVLVLSYSGLKSQNSAEAIIIEQPKDVIECVGSLDQYLFVVAAPSDRHYKIAYRWLKDERPITNWVEDFGQLTFDTLKFSMSGVYYAEIFAFDPNWTSLYGNPFSYDSARVSPIVKSEPTNLYVLQHPSFMKDIPYQIVKKGGNYIMTFEANIYGEHNMANPTYWTQIQWFKDSVALKDDDRISGSQSSILTISNIKETDYSTKYRVRLIGECDTTWSNEFAIYDEPRPMWTGIDVLDWGCVGKTTMFWFWNYSSVPGIEIKNQWYMDGKILEDIPGLVSGSTNDTLLIYLDTNNTFNYEASFICKVWPEGYPDNFEYGANSHIEFIRPPFILKDLDSSYTIEEGKLLKLGILAKGTTIRYYWQKDNENRFQLDDTLRLGKIRLDQSGKYQVIVVNDCDTVYSRVAEVIVTKKAIITGIDSQSGYGLHQNYPNPFNVNSTISWNSERSGNAVMTLSDVLGNKVATLFDGYVNAGELKEVRLNANTLNLSTGTYYVTFTMGDKVQTKQISVVR